MIEFVRTFQRGHLQLGLVNSELSRYLTANLSLHTNNEVTHPSKE